MTAFCRVCGSPSSDLPILSLPAPGMTSIGTTLDAETVVRACRSCGHAYGPEPVELAAYYDQEYKISLASDDHDQLYAVIDGTPVYRTQRQVDVMCGLVTLRDGMKVLDYGAAKAQSLRRLMQLSPDVTPHVFDVSRDYEAYWTGWIASEHMATYELPSGWAGRFDLVTSYFVLEHVSFPVQHLCDLSALLAPNGRLFVMVPDALHNVGDLLVIDHVNHFTAASLQKAFAMAGLEIEALDDTGFAGALAVVGRRSADPSPPADDAVVATTDALCEAGEAWSRAHAALRAAAALHRGARTAIHGAGFYGAYALQVIGDVLDVCCFVDANPFLHGATVAGRPVVALGALPDDVDLVVVALNPARARDMAPDGSVYGRPNVSMIYVGG